MCYPLLWQFCHAWGVGKGIHMMHQLFQQSCRQDSVGSVLPWWIEERTPGLDHYPKAGMETLLFGAPALQCGLHEKEIASKTLPKITGRGSQRNSPWPPLHGDPHRCWWWTILQVAGQVYQGERTLAPSALSRWQQDNCMRELWQEWNRHMSRAGLQGTPGLAGPSKSRRCSHGHSTLQTHSLSAEQQGREAAKWPREDSPVGWSGSQRWHSQLRSKSKVVPKSLTTMWSAISFTLL